MNHEETKIWFDVEGGSKPLVLFVHGYNASSTSFTSIKKLERNYRVVVMDMPGFGKSKTDAEITFQLLVDSVNHVIEEIGEELILVGHSLGGGVIAAVENTHVKHKILISPFNPLLANKTDINELKKILVPSDIEEAKYSLSKVVWNKGNDLYWNNIDFNAKHFLAKVENEKDKMSHILNDVILSLDFQINTLSPFFDKLDGQTLIQGIHDEVNKTSIIDELAQKYNFEYFKLNESGHAPAFEEPEEVNKIIESKINI